MADFRYQTICDPLTGVCMDIDTVSGEPRVDQRTGQPVVIYDPQTRDVTGTPEQQAAIAAGTMPTPKAQQVLPEGVSEGAIDYDLIYPDSTSTSGGGGGYTDYGYSGGYTSYGRGGGTGYRAESDPPYYADRSLHPFFGGDARTPGGYFADQDTGYDNRQQVTATSGATAGPYAVRSAPSPSIPQRGGSGGGGGGGGGGGIARDLYWSMANKIKGKLMGGESGSTESYKPEKYRPYRGPDDPRVRRRVEDLQLREANRNVFFSDPTGLIPSGVSGYAPHTLELKNQPMTDLALIAGAGKRNWAGGMDPTEDIYNDYYQKLGKRLKKGKPGIDFLPFYKKALRKDKSAEDFRRTTSDLYGDLTSGERWDTNALMSNLMNPARGTFLREQFARGKTPRATGIDQFNRSFGAILGSGNYDEDQQAALDMIRQDLMMQYGQQFGGRRKAPNVNQWVGARLQPYMRDNTQGGNPYG
jgi:hypothetical protein